MVNEGDADSVPVMLELRSTIWKEYDGKKNKARKNGELVVYSAFPKNLGPLVLINDVDH